MRAPFLPAVLVVAVLSVTAARPACAQTFQERWWSPIPKADAAEQPHGEQGKIPENINRQDRSQEQVRAPSHRSNRHALILQQRKPAPITQQTAHTRGVMVGKASFYAQYHRSELTAASRTLPFGTRLRVTDLKTKKSVEVTVTDRGPASNRLILDLSLGAAQQLGIASRGIIQVRAEIVG